MIASWILAGVAAKPAHPEAVQLKGGHFVLDCRFQDLDLLQQQRPDTACRRKE